MGTKTVHAVFPATRKSSWFGRNYYQGIIRIFHMDGTLLILDADPIRYIDPKMAMRQAQIRAMEYCAYLNAFDGVQYVIPADDGVWDGRRQASHSI